MLSQWAKQKRERVLKKILIPVSLLSSILYVGCVDSPSEEKESSNTQSITTDDQVNLEAHAKEIGSPLFTNPLYAAEFEAGNKDDENPSRNLTKNPLWKPWKETLNTDGTALLKASAADGVPAYSCVYKGTYLQSSSLNRGECLMDPTGKYLLIMQTDGNLVGYRNWDGTWYYQSRTGSLGITRASMQSDGNFVLYAGTTWKQQTRSNGWSYFGQAVKFEYRGPEMYIFSDDGHIEFWKRILWCSGNTYNPWYTCGSDQGYPSVLYKKN